MTGKVYLIGAGPGDYKLITVKGRECIEAASVIVYDYLADEKILRWARPDAERIYAGKQANNHTLTQEEINALLVEKGLEGHIVARLKGGDPLVFGRGGEEALALREAGVPFEFVPGVTSAIAAPAYAGIPVTHRAVATSFAVVTGHEDPTKPESGMHWEHLAQSVDTLCFVMGVSNLPHITAQLIAHGRPADQPAAVIRWGTKPEQEVLVSTLGEVAEDVKRAGLKAPAIFMAGDVVRLREKLRWFDTKPLFGKTVVVTRARAQASSLVAQLEALGANVLESPAIETIPLALPEEQQGVWHQLRQYAWLVFTSAQGVHYFFQALQAAGQDSRALGHMKFCAIGSATARALREKGFLVDVMPETYQAESVVTALQGEVEAGQHVLLVQPQLARTVIPEGLQSLGIDLTVLRLYETKQSTLGAEALRAALAAGTVDYVTFTSSSTVTNTLELLGEDAATQLAKTKVVAIGPITAATCVEEGLSVDLLSDTFTVEAMVDAIVADANPKEA